MWFSVFSKHSRKLLFSKVPSLWNASTEALKAESIVKPFTDSTFRKEKEKKEQKPKPNNNNNKNLSEKVWGQHKWKYPYKLA